MPQTNQTRRAEGTAGLGISSFPGGIDIRENSRIETPAQGKFLGIDIGVTGGIAILSASGELIEVHEMPVLADGPAGRRAVNAPLLASIVFKSHAVHAFVEHVSARPGVGAVGAFAFGPPVGSSRAFWPPLGFPARF